MIVAFIEAGAIVNIKYKVNIYILYKTIMLFIFLKYENGILMYENNSLIYEYF